MHGGNRIFKFPCRVEHCYICLGDCAIAVITTIDFNFVILLGTHSRQVLIEKGFKEMKLPSEKYTAAD